MGRFLAGKCLRLVVLMFLVSFGAFVLVSMSPLDPLSTNVGQAALGSMSQEQVAKMEAYWGGGDAACRAVPLLGREFFTGGYGCVFAVPPACGRSDFGEV